MTDGASGGAPARRRRRVPAWSLYPLFCALGVVVAYWPTWSSGFARMQAERGDSMHQNYVLEHQFRHLFGWMGRGEALGSFWSPGYFHPEPSGLAYSENLLGTLPFYAVARLVFAPSTSFQIWGMAVLAANFAAMVWVLRRQGVRPLFAAAGGFAFAFALVRAGHLNHPHLLPQFAAPIAVWALLTWTDAPRLAAWIALWAAVALQLLMSLHLGWFLLFALLVLSVSRIAIEPGVVRRCARWLWAERLPAVGAALAAIGVVISILWPYAVARRTYGVRDDAQVVLFAPRVSSWLSAPSNSLPAAVGVASDPQSPSFWEHELFPGFVAIALGGLAFSASIGSIRSNRSKVVTSAMRAAIFAVAAIVAVSLYVPRAEGGPSPTSLRDSGWTLWWLVWDWLPGASNMRAVGRVWSAVLPLLVFAGWCALEERLRSAEAARSPWAKRAAAAAVPLVLLALVEQMRFAQPSFDKTAYFKTVEAWSRSVPRECRAVYFAPPAPRATGAPWWVGQTTAMWAALEAGVPTVNAYTSNYPPGYPPPERAATREEIDAWLRSRGTEALEPACYLTPGSL
jgi:hypothetical protein